MTELVIEARAVTKRYGETVALDECDLRVPAGAVVTLLGPSGTGKSTMLRVLAGFDRPDSGHIDIRGRTMVGPGIFVPPEQRRVGVVLQDYALFPHMAVRANVGYGLPKDRDRDRRIDEILDVVGLTGLGGRFPHELSGGQQQRVALARALAPSPDVVILDEPFSNLDDTLRSRVRAEIISIIREAGTTALFITHDQEEALSISDFVAVMSRGRIIQMAEPHELYWEPADAWVGSFVGDANFVRGLGKAGSVESVIGAFREEAEGEVWLMVRPEQVRLQVDPSGVARVTGREFFGHDQLVTVAFDDGTLMRSRMGPGDQFSPGDRVRVDVDAVTVFPG